MQIGYEQQITRLFEAYAVHDEEALAMQLQKEISNLRVWRSRDHVPKQVLYEAAAATGYSFPWLCFEPGAVKQGSLKTPKDDRLRAVQSESTTQEALLLTEREYKLVVNFRTASEAGKNAVEMMCAATQKSLVKKKAAK